MIKRERRLLALFFMSAVLLTNVLTTFAEKNEAGPDGEEVVSKQENSFMDQVKTLERRLIEEEGNNPDELMNKRAKQRNSRPTVSEVIGMDGIVYMDWMRSHENDTYYITTPYNPGWIPNSGMSADYRNPNGDCQGAYGAADRPGVPGMNCTGFVWHALKTPAEMSGGNVSIIPAVSGWVSFYTNHNIERQYFKSKEEMLASGYLEKGDIIWMFDGGTEGAVSDIHHVGIYWGDGNSDVIWHSINGASDGNGMEYDGNVVSHIFGKSSNILYVAIKVGGEERGSIELRKASANPEITNDNSCYSLEGAVYGVYDAGNNQIAALTTDRSGYAKTENLPIGTYTVKEVTPPKGFVKDESSYTVTVPAGAVEVLNVKDYPQKGQILLEKVDSETGQGSPQGAASLKGAVYDIFLKSAYQKGDNTESASYKGSLLTDQQGRAASAELPLETYYVIERQPGNGYLVDSEIHEVKLTAENTVDSVFTKTVKSKEDILRGDVEIIKLRENEDEDEDTIQGIEGIEFTFTSDTTGKAVKVIKTDKYGFATTKDPSHPRGSLIFDTYTVTETKYPEGLKPIEPFKVTISENSVTLKGIYREDKLIVSPVTVVKADAETEKNIPIANAEFRLLDADKRPVTMITHYPDKVMHESFKTDENGQFTFPKKLKYGTYYLEELNAPEGYLKGELLKFQVSDGAIWEKPLVIKYVDENAMGRIKVKKTDEETGELLKGAEFDIIAEQDIITPDGTLRVKAGETAEHLITGEDGTAETKELYLGKYIIKETKQPDGYILPERTWKVELTYKDQNTAVVTEELKAANKPTELLVKKIESKTEKALPGVTFKIWKKDMVSEKTDSGQEIVSEYVTDENGEIVIKKLVPGTYCVQEVKTLPGYVSDDTVHEITIDMTGRVAGKDVGIVTVENDRTEITETRVIDIETDRQVIYPKNVKAVDTVSMKNLQPGETYLLKSELYNVKTGRPCRKDNSMRGEILQWEHKFTATKSKMDVEVDIYFSAENFAGQTLVVFERLYQDNVEISTHTDLKDTKQQLTIKNPKIGTTAMDVLSGTHEAAAKKDVKIRDSVKYEDMIPGTYILKGVIMEQQTKEPLLINGKQVTAERKIKITKANGMIDMDFTIDASELNNRSIVIFEYLYYDKMLVAAHEDINDRNQMITFKEEKLPPEEKLPSDAPETGDQMELMPWIMLIISIAAMILTFAGKYKRRR